MASEMGEIAVRTTHLPCAARPTLWVSAALGGTQTVLRVLRFFELFIYLFCTN